MSDDEKVEEVKEEKVEETKVEETKAEEVKAEVKEEKKEKAAPSGKFKDLIKSIEELSVLELAELVKELEERFGVSAAAPMMAMGAMPAAGAAAPAEEEKANYTIHIADAGAQKIAVIKVIREIRQDLGLKEAKDLVDGAPKDVKSDVPKADAEEAKKKLEAAGAKVELK
jgi:large subunit ribosomal protein L7/L12